MLSRGLPVNPGEPPTSPEQGAVLPNPKRTRSRGETRVVPREANRPSTWSTCRQGRPEVAGKGRRAVVCAHSTDEGGKPQGFRKERPRYPPEGRGKQEDVSMECHIREAQNSRSMSKS